MYNWYPKSLGPENVIPNPCPNCNEDISKIGWEYYGYVGKFKCRECEQTMNINSPHIIEIEGY